MDGEHKLTAGLFACKQHVKAHEAAERREEKKMKMLTKVQSASSSATASTSFCVCGAGEDGLYVECAVGTGGCNGWVHPRCIGLSEEEAQQKNALVCPLCDFEERNKPKQRTQFKPTKTGAGGSISGASGGDGGVNGNSTSTVVAVPVTTFCVCGAGEGGMYVECAVGTSGCNGWVHPRCIGLSDEEAQQKSALVCPLCEFGTLI
jgi:hypothetical protein